LQKFSSLAEYQKKNLDGLRQILEIFSREFLKISEKLLSKCQKLSKINMVQILKHVHAKFQLFSL
jgi:hypothetical protein